MKTSIDRDFPAPRPSYQPRVPRVLVRILSIVILAPINGMLFAYHFIYGMNFFSSWIHLESRGFLTLLVQIVIAKVILVILSLVGVISSCVSSARGQFTPLSFILSIAPMVLTILTSMFLTMTV